jgi:hypothetical protein
MRSTLVLSVLAAVLVASAAFAAKPQTATAELSSLAASGIIGSADFRADGDGNVRVHEQLSGLTPGAEYVSVIYLASATCGSGAVRVEIMQFTANNAGRANFNVALAPQAVPAIDGGASITVEQGTTQLSCGEIVVQ